MICCLKALARTATTHVVLAFAALGFAGSLLAQDDPGGANLSDVESIDAIVAAVYDVISGPAGADRDWDRMRSFGFRFMSVDDWIEGATGYFSDNAFFEVEIHRAEGGAFDRGINSFQLLYDGERWWIVNIFWQAETEAEPIPADYLP